MSRRLATIALVTGVAAVAAPAPAGAASVDVLVAGKDRVLRDASSVRLKARRLKVGSRRCAVGAATPLAALAGTRLPLRIKDYGSCGRAARDAGGLFVKQVGPDRNRGRNGWVYKIGRKAGTAGAGDPSGPFGDGHRLRDGQRVTWFYCVYAGDSCQRTLEATPATRTVARGATLRVTVRGYDDLGRAEPVAGATVTLGDATAATGADGVAELSVPADAPARLRLRAEAAGLVPAFPSQVRVG